MAKRMLSDLAVEFAVICRDDKSKTYGWAEITNMVNEKYGTNVTWQAVSERYRNYKKKHHDNSGSLSQANSSELKQVEHGSEQVTVNNPIQPNQDPTPKSQIDLATLIMGTGVRGSSSSNIDTDQAVGKGENYPRPRRKSFFDAPFKRNDVLSDEEKRILGLS